MANNLRLFLISATITQGVFNLNHVCITPHVHNSSLFIRKLLFLQFLRHTEFISASLQLKEVLKEVQDDEIISAFFIITLYQYFSLKEPNSYSKNYKINI